MAEITRSLGIGTGLRRLGDIGLEFGLQMLKSGMDQRKQRRLQDMLIRYDEHMKTLGIPEEQRKENLQGAFTIAVSASERAGRGPTEETIEERQARAEEIGRPVGIPIEQAERGALGILKGEPPEAAPGVPAAVGPVVSREIVPGKEIGVPGRLTDILARTRGQAAALEKGITGEEARELRRMVLEAGGTQADIARIEQAARGRITAAGLADVETAAKQRELDIRQGEVQSKNIYRMKMTAIRDETNRLRKEIADNLNKRAIAIATLRDRTSRLRVGEMTQDNVARRLKEAVNSRKWAQEHLDWGDGMRERQVVEGTGVFGTGLFAEYNEILTDKGTEIQGIINDADEVIRTLLPRLKSGGRAKLFSGVGALRESDIPAELREAGRRTAEEILKPTPPKTPPVSLEQFQK